MLTFLEWVVQLKEGLMSPQQSEGDEVCFGIHDMNGPIDVNKMRNKISRIHSIHGKYAMVPKPNETRHRGMKKMMAKDTGLLKLATSSLHKVPDEMVIGGDGSHKLFLYMPGDYHRGMARKIDKKMMAADAPLALPAPQAQQQIQQGQQPQTVQQPQQGQQPQATHQPLQRQRSNYDIEPHDDEPQWRLAARYRDMYKSPGDPTKR